LSSVKSTGAVFDSISIENSTAVAYVSYPSIENDNYAIGETGNTPIYSKTVIDKNGISFKEKVGSGNWSEKFYYGSDGNLTANSITSAEDITVGEDLTVTDDTFLEGDLAIKGSITT
jgi:hypothetical protein